MIRTLFLFLFVAGVSFGQDSTATRNKEIYLTFADFSPLNIQFKYKHQIGQRTYLKFGLVNLSAARVSYVPNSPSNFINTDWDYSAGIEVGIEFRKPLTEKLSFFHGPSLRYTYENSTRYISNPISPNQKMMEEIQTASIPYSLGVLFSVTPKLLLAAEINPSINFMHYKNDNGTNKNISNGFGFSFDNRFGLLSIALRF